jgi:outer membrane protein assembly factor BamB
METLNRREQMRAGRGRHIVARLLGALLIALVADLLFSLLVPIVGFIHLQILRNVFFPQPTLPDHIAALATTASIWDGRLYASDASQGTRVYDLRSGAQVGAFPGVVVGSDSQYVYSSAGAASPGENFAAGLLSARDSRGEVIWSHQAASFTRAWAPNEGTPRSPYLSDAHNVYLVAPPAPGSAQQVVIALDKTTGAERWRSAATHVGGLALAQGALAVLTYGSPMSLTARSASDGRVLWSQPLDAIAVTFSTDGQSLYLLDYQGVHALSPQTGAQRWSVAYRPVTSGSPFLVDGDMTYLLDASDQVIAIDSRDGSQRWRTPTTADGREIQVEELIAAQGDVLYQMIAGPQLSAVDGASGKPLWTTPLPASGLHTLIGVANGALYLEGVTGCGNTGGSCAETFAVEQATGKLLWSRVVPQGVAQTLPEIIPAVALAGQSLYIVGATQRTRPVNGPGYFSPRQVYGACSDTASVVSLSTVSGAIAWSHSGAEVACKRGQV